MPRYSRVVKGAAAVVHSQPAITTVTLSVPKQHVAALYKYVSSLWVNSQETPKRGPPTDSKLRSGVSSEAGSDHLTAAPSVSSGTTGRQSRSRARASKGVRTPGNPVFNEQTDGLVAKARMLKQLSKEASRPHFSAHLAVEAEQVLGRAFEVDLQHDEYEAVRQQALDDAHAKVKLATARRLEAAAKSRVHEMKYAQAVARLATDTSTMPQEAAQQTQAIYDAVHDDVQSLAGVPVADRKKRVRGAKGSDRAGGSAPRAIQAPPAYVEQKDSLASYMTTWAGDPLATVVENLAREFGMDKLHTDYKRPKGGKVLRRDGLRYTVEGAYLSDCDDAFTAFCKAKLTSIDEDAIDEYRSKVGKYCLIDPRGLVFMRNESTS